MTDLTALDVIRNLSLGATMAIVTDLGDAVDWDDKSCHGLKPTVTLA